MELAILAILAILENYLPNLIAITKATGNWPAPQRGLIDGLNHYHQNQYRSTRTREDEQDEEKKFMQLCSLFFRKEMRMQAKQSNVSSFDHDARHCAF